MRIALGFHEFNAVVVGDTKGSPQSTEMGEAAIDHDVADRDMAARAEKGAGDRYGRRGAIHHLIEGFRVSRAELGHLTGDLDVRIVQVDGDDLKGHTGRSRLDHGDALRESRRRKTTGG